MAKKFINKSYINGVLYEHKLEEKTSGPASKNPGTQFIAGTISVATDDALTNIVDVHYSYVTATTKNGSANSTYTTLKNIIDGTYKSIMSSSANEAVKLKIDSALALNEFYTEDRMTKEEVLVSVKRNEGGFIHVVSALDENEADRSTFDCDMLITNVSIKEADEERGLPEKAIVKGAIFDFRGSLLPTEFSAINPKAIAYFEGLEASATNPVFTKVWGKQVSETISRTITEENAFGEAQVRKIDNTRKDFVITGASKEPYVWDSEDTMTAEELKKAMADRELYLASEKQRRADYLASKNTATPINNNGFNF